MLIAILGKKHSGKDTIANFLIEKYGFTKYSFADPLKKGIQAFFNLTDQQLNDQKLKEEIDPRWGVSPRKLFQVIGTDFFQNSIRDFLPELKINNEDPKNHWVNLFKEWYYQNLEKKIVISDVRFLHEINTIKGLGGVIYKVIRTRIYDNDNDNDNDIDVNNNYYYHQSEKEIENIPDDMINDIIINDKSLEELYLLVDVKMKLK